QIDTPLLPAWASGQLPSHTRPDDLWLGLFGDRDCRGIEPLDDQPKGQHHQQVAATKAGCSTAMAPASFANMKKSVESKPFSDTKMSTAKVATKNACLSVEQVKEIGKLFMMDDEKRAYAEFAYDYCVDKGNYYQVSDIFSFSSTTEDFNKFLESK
ncbi:MAG TPA: DUF4476 domain-containing protein, partial [Bacteroidia bacterium]|nr:DUF4476 domain-containing protein [Bacteroidia bacterium]